MFNEKSCPKCYAIRESELPQDFHCPTCGRRKSLFITEVSTKQEADEFTIHLLRSQLADMTERHDAHKANYEYMAKRCAEQQKEIEALKAQAGSRESTWTSAEISRRSLSTKRLSR